MDGNQTLTFGSLFAGIGGFDIAAERAGMEVAFQVENDKFARRILEREWPNVPNYGDIREVKSVPTVDVLAGGFPCQPFSLAGRMGGLDDKRGELWWDFHRLVTDSRPRWVVAENVPGLLSAGRGRAFREVVSSLVNSGYGVVYRVLDSQYFGVAQRRKRVFIVGHSGGQPRPEILALAEGVSGYLEPVREERAAPAGVAASGVGGSSHTAHSLTSSDGGLSAKLNQVTLVSSSGRDQTGTITAAFANKYSSLDNVKGGSLVAGTSVRRLTPTECERLQGFEDGWTEGLSDNQRYKVLGNAVTVPVAEWIMKRIVEFD